MSLPFALSPPLRGPLELTPRGYFGAERPTRGAIHMGVDLAADTGDAVVSATLGKVARTGYDKPVSEGGGGGGNYVIVSTGDYEIGYMHLDQVAVQAGDQVQAGALLGAAGATGTIDGGAHLHFQVKQPGPPARFIDPTDELKLERPAAPKKSGRGALLAVGVIAGVVWLWGDA